MRFPRPSWGGRPPADYRVDRPEVEAPRGAREPTGTNGPTLTNTSTTNVYTVWLTDTVKCSSNHYTDHNQHNPPRNRYISGMLSEYWLNHLVVVIAAGKRPASIPNLEAKPASADGTAPGRVWESRTPPQHSIQAGGALGTHVPSPTRLLYAPTRIHDHAHRTSEHNPTTHSQ